MGFVVGHEGGRDSSGDAARSKGETGAEDPVIGEHLFQVRVSIRPKPSFLKKTHTKPLGKGLDVGLLPKPSAGLLVLEVQPVKVAGDDLGSRSSFAVHCLSGSGLLGPGASGDAPTAAFFLLGILTGDVGAGGSILVHGIICV